MWKPFATWKLIKSEIVQDMFPWSCVKADLDDHLACGSLKGAAEQLEDAAEQLKGLAA